MAFDLIHRYPTVDFAKERKGHAVTGDSVNKAGLARVRNRGAEGSLRQGWSILAQILGRWSIAPVRLKVFWVRGRPGMAVCLNVPGTLASID